MEESKSFLCLYTKLCTAIRNVVYVVNMLAYNCTLCTRFVAPCYMCGRYSEDSLKLSNPCPVIEFSSCIYLAKIYICEDNKTMQAKKYIR